MSHINYFLKNMFFIYGILTGIIATIIFDIFQFSLSYAYNINKARWDLVGRYFIGLKEKKFFREDIENENQIKNELFIGYLVHYLIGVIYGIFYIILNLFLSNNPSLYLALIVGFISVLGAWCIMMPYAYNIGFFASKKEEQKQIIVQNLIAHFIFGVGLYIGYLTII